MYENTKNLNESLTKDNAELKQYNFDLFRQVGSQETNSNDASLNQEDGKEPEKMKFEDLFDEKGEFK